MRFCAHALFLPTFLFIVSQIVSICGAFETLAVIDADGINDKWMLFGDPKIVVNIKELRIFDRWGEQMYEAFNFPVNDPQYGWDGKLRGKNLKPAVFVYYFEAEFVDGSRRLYKGGINLIR